MNSSNIRTNISLCYKFMRFMSPYRKKWFLILILTNAAALLTLINPYLAKLVIDEGIGKRDLRAFMIIALIGAGLFVFNGFVDGIKAILERSIRTRVNFDLNKKLFRHMQNFSLKWFNERSTGEHIYKFDNDLGAITHLITDTLPQVLFIFPAFIGTLAIIFYLNWKMALASIFLMPLLYIPLYYTGKRIQKICEDFTKRSEDILNILQETFSHIALIKVFGREIAALRRYLKALAVNIRIDVKSGKWENVSAFANGLSVKVMIGMLTFYGGYEAIRGHMSLGTLGAVVLYLHKFVELGSQFASFFETVMVGSISARRISAILDEAPEISEIEKAKDIIMENAEVVFNNVTFGYKPQRYVLKNLSFRIEKGGHIAIAGPSGCGKTTLLNLLIRLYDPSEGEITIDNHDIKGLKISSLKRQIGFVMQEPFLWNDTVENNIRYGRAGARPEETAVAARAAGVDEFARNLNSGYATIIGENACKLSQGQKQKIAIARALIKNPRILILDEAMSSMDSASEEKIVSNIKNSRRDLTMITVSHRLSTVRGADLVYYLFRPDEMIIDSPQNLLEYNKNFSGLFTARG